MAINDNIWQLFKNCHIYNHLVTNNIAIAYDNMAILFKKKFYARACTSVKCISDIQNNFLHRFCNTCAITLG